MVVFGTYHMRTVLKYHIIPREYINFVPRAVDTDFWEIFFTRLAAAKGQGNFYII